MSWEGKVGVDSRLRLRKGAVGQWEDGGRENGTHLSPPRRHVVVLRSGGLLGTERWDGMESTKWQVDGVESNVFGYGGSGCQPLHHTLTGVVRQSRHGMQKGSLEHVLGSESASLSIFISKTRWCDGGGIMPSITRVERRFYHRMRSTRGRMKEENIGRMKEENIRAWQSGCHS